MEIRRSLARINSTTFGVHSSPFSENNASPLRRKSISSGNSNIKSHADDESPKSPAHTSFLRLPNSPLRRTSNSPSPSVPNRKSPAENPRRLQKQSSSDDLQSRGLWPTSKKLNPSADADIASDPLGDNDDDCRHAGTYKVSTFSSRQRDQQGGERGGKSLRQHVGKIQVERSMKKPGTPPSPSSSGQPPPLGRVSSGRLSFNEARKRSDFGAEFRSMERSESMGTSPRVSVSTGRRPKSPVQSPQPTAKGKGGGVGELISQGFSNLFRRKSFQGLHASAGTGSPGKDRTVKVKGVGSPRIETAVAGRTVGSPARGAVAAAVDVEAQQRLRMMHNSLIQWRFVNAGTAIVNKTMKVNAQVCRLVPSSSTSSS